MEIDIESMKSTLELYWDLKSGKPLKTNVNEVFKKEASIYADQIEFKDSSGFIILT